MSMTDASGAPATGPIPAGVAMGRAGADPELRRLLLTSDLRAATGLPRTHMDYYLREGIVRPVARTESGYLLFDPTELDVLRAVLRWRDEGVGIREIRDRIGRPAGS
ncbi:MAG: MerR family transcriptional regulator [Chloroflexota bacterium]